MGGDDLRAIFGQGFPEIWAECIFGHHEAVIPIRPLRVLNGQIRLPNFVSSRRHNGFGYPIPARPIGGSTLTSLPQEDDYA